MYKRTANFDFNTTPKFWHTSNICRTSVITDITYISIINYTVCKLNVSMKLPLLWQQTRSIWLFCQYITPGRVPSTIQAGRLYEYTICYLCIPPLNCRPYTTTLHIFIPSFLSLVKSFVSLMNFWWTLRKDIKFKKLLIVVMQVWSSKNILKSY